MFEKRIEIVRFLAVAETGQVSAAAERLAMNQPALSRIIVRLERRFGRPLFERVPGGMRLTALGAGVAERARRILREYEDAERALDAAIAGRAGGFRVTANPTWSETVLARVTARFHEAFPAIELAFETVTRAEGLRRLEVGESDLHCGGVDDGAPLPRHLRRERFIDMTAGIVASRDHPLTARRVTRADLARYPWVDFDSPATPPPGDGRPTLAALLRTLHDTTHRRVQTVARSRTAGLYVMAGAPYLAWLAVTFIERLPGAFLRPLPIAFGTYVYRSGFVARRSAESLPPFRRLEALVCETALASSA